MRQDDLFDFDGPAYERRYDQVRLSRQIADVWKAMIDGRWHTLGEVARRTGHPEASISAQLRHLRKDRFGAHTVERRARGERRHGLWEYRLVPNHPERMEVNDEQAGDTITKAPQSEGIG